MKEDEPQHVKMGVHLRERLPELTPTEKALLLSLALRINEERLCWPSIDTLVNEVGCGERNLHYALNSLVAKGFVFIGRRAGGRKKGGVGRTNLYTLNGYFAYGKEPLQLVAPFMGPLLTKGATTEGVPDRPQLSKGATGEGAERTKKGAIRDEKGAIPDKRRVPNRKGGRRTSTEEEPVVKKNQSTKASSAPAGKNPRVLDLQGDTALLDALKREFPEQNIGLALIACDDYWGDRARAPKKAFINWLQKAEQFRKQGRPPGRATRVEARRDMRDFEGQEW